MNDDPPSRLAVFLPDLSGGGAERVMLNLAGGIAERGYRVDLVLAQADGAYLDDVPNSVRLVDLGQGRVGTRLKTARRLPALVRYLRRERPDTLLAALVEANVVAVVARMLARAPKRLVVCVQNTQSQKSGRSEFEGLQRWHPIASRTAYHWSDMVVGVSQGVIDDLVENIGVPIDRTAVIYNPVITDQLRANAKARPDHPWFEPGEPPVIVSVGRLDEQKDYGTLLHAFKQVRSTRPARLLILGEGGERRSLEALISELGLSDDVSMPGFVRNPHAFMASAAVYVLSSRWEGLPTVLIEAMYCGVPLVATDCPSGPREILMDGELGCLVPMRNPTELAANMARALDGAIPRASRDGWRRFELQTVVDRYIEVLFPTEPQ